MVGNMKPEIEEWYNKLTEEQKSRLDIFVIFGGKDNRRITQRQALFEGEDIPQFIERFVDDPNVPSLEETVREIENKYEYVKGELIERVQ